MPADAAPRRSTPWLRAPSSTLSTRSTISPTCSPALPIIRHGALPNSCPLELAARRHHPRRRLSRPTRRVLTDNQVRRQLLGDVQAQIHNFLWTRGTVRLVSLPKKNSIAGAGCGALRGAGISLPSPSRFSSDSLQ